MVDVETTTCLRVNIASVIKTVMVDKRMSGI